MTALEARDAATAPPEGEGGVLSRPYLALSIGIVFVELLIAFEATAVGTAGVNNAEPYKLGRSRPRR